MPQIHEPHFSVPDRFAYYFCPIDGAGKALVSSASGAGKISIWGLGQVGEVGRRRRSSEASPGLVQALKCSSAELEVSHLRTYCFYLSYGFDSLWDIARCHEESPAVFARASQISISCQQKSSYIMHHASRPMPGHDFSRGGGEVMAPSSNNHHLLERPLRRVSVDYRMGYTYVVG